MSRLLRTLKAMRKRVVKLPWGWGMLLVVTLTAIYVTVQWRADDQRLNLIQTVVAVIELPALVVAFLKLRDEIRRRSKVYKARVSVLPGVPHRSTFHNRFKSPDGDYPISVDFPLPPRNQGVNYSFCLVVIVYDEVMLHAPMLTVWWDGAPGAIRPHMVTTEMGDGFQAENVQDMNIVTNRQSKGSYRLFVPTGYIPFKHPVIYGFNFAADGQNGPCTTVLHCELWGSNLVTPVTQDIQITLVEQDRSNP